jgi:hypothetical protein
MWSRKSHNLPLQTLKVIIYSYLSHYLALRMNASNIAEPYSVSPFLCCREKEHILILLGWKTFVFQELIIRTGLSSLRRICHGDSITSYWVELLWLATPSQFHFVLYNIVRHQMKCCKRVLSFRCNRFLQKKPCV